jgi:ribose 5-phosphate isomerase RpiB
MEWVKIFLETPFEGGRHERRVRKMDAPEGEGAGR